MKKKNKKNEEEVSEKDGDVVTKVYRFDWTQYLVILSIRLV